MCAGMSLMGFLRSKWQNASANVRKAAEAAVLITIVVIVAGSTVVGIFYASKPPPQLIKVCNS